MEYQQDLPVVVVGGGPAGMMAAIQAARRGLTVTLLERNEKLGKKLYITGKGRCNLTNDGSLEHLLANTVRNGRFLYSAFSAFGSRDLMAFIEELGVPLVVERGQRVFPASGKSSDILRVLQKEIARLGVEVQLGQRVAAIVAQEGRVSAVRTVAGREIPCAVVVLATGGLSYSATGSTGDGYRLAQALGHTVEPQSPSLIPIETNEGWPAQLQGLALKNIRMTVEQDAKIVYSDVGKMLFTHFGISGPLVLTASALLDANRLADARLLLDMKPGLTAEQLDARLLRDFQSSPNRALKNLMPELAPARMGSVVLALAGLDGEVPVHQITRGQREKLASTLKTLVLTPARMRPMEEAVITRGGITCKEVQPKTMQSKRVQGLYLCGETLDVDALTGGFNLQIAFSTGFAAGSHC